MREWRLDPRNRKAQNESSQRYRDRNPDRRQALYEANREIEITRARAYYQANAERLRIEARSRRAENRVRARASARAWQLEHLEEGRQYSRQRREKIRSTQKGRVDYLQILERVGFLCGICGEFLDPNNIHFDHIIPIAKGGKHIAKNIQPTHPKCNLAKATSVG